MDKGICPFSKEECDTVKCQLWDFNIDRCVFVSITVNLAKISNVIDTVIDKMVYKH